MKYKERFNVEINCSKKLKRVWTIPFGWLREENAAERRLSWTEMRCQSLVEQGWEIPKSWNITLNPVGGADSGHGGEIKTEEPDTEATHLGEINHREYLGH